MKRPAKKNEAVDILQRRYIQNKPKREISLQEERDNAEFARMIYNARIEAGLSQKQMAEMVGQHNLSSVGWKTRITAAIH